LAQRKEKPAGTTLGGFFIAAMDCGSRRGRGVKGCGGSVSDAD
jgi:hypothetical protein